MLTSNNQDKMKSFKIITTTYDDGSRLYYPYVKFNILWCIPIWISVHAYDGIDARYFEQSIFGKHKHDTYEEAQRSIDYYFGRKQLSKLVEIKKY